MCSSDDSDYETPLKCALPVSDNDSDIDMDQIPLTGMDFVKRARKEAKLCPKIVVVKPQAKHLQSSVPMKTLPETDDKITVSNQDVPTFECQLERTASFSTVRELFQKSKKLLAPNKNQLLVAHTSSEWYKLLYENATEPSLSLVASLNSSTVHKLLEYHVSWFNDLITGDSLTRLHCQWIFCLLVYIQKPLSPEYCDLLRNLAKRSSMLRASLTTTNTDAMHLKCALSLIICIIARYFSQTDLAD